MKQQILKMILIAYKKYSLLEIDTITKFLLFDEIYNWRGHNIVKTLLVNKL